MKVFTSETHKPIKAWIDHVPPVEKEAMLQLKRIAAMPFIYRHVACMPDVHLGIGATIGSVIATDKAIIPAAVGVDLGCGLLAVRTSLVASQLPDSLAALRSVIETAVPHGRTDSGGTNDKGAHSSDSLSSERNNAWGRLLTGYLRITADYQKCSHPGIITQLGTLGSGNHFIEICLDEQDRVWVMLHSGSRGVGNKIGTTFISLAKKEMQGWHIHLPDADLAYLPEGSQHFKAYCDAVSWAQDYALENRQLMMSATLNCLKAIIPIPMQTDCESVSCHHNYVSRENHFGRNVIVTRKGAVSAREGQLGLIPGAMGKQSFVVRGKGNADSFHSCSHGAGRLMSRTQAKKTFTLADHAKATEGVECRKDIDVIDETPGAYKNIADVMRSQEDLVDIVHTLRAVLTVKG